MVLTTGQYGQIHPGTHVGTIVFSRLRAAIKEEHNLFVLFLVPVMIQDVRRCHTFVAMKTLQEAQGGVVRHSHGKVEVDVVPDKDYTRLWANESELTCWEQVRLRVRQQKCLLNAKLQLTT